MTAWVDSAKRGRPVEAVFETLYRRHSRSTRGRIVAVLKEHAMLADDLLQETWVEVAATREWAPRSFRAWVHTIAMRKALDRYARHDLRTRLVGGSGDEPRDPLQAVPSRDAQPDEVAATRALARVVVGIVARLSPERREAWTLRHVEQQPYEEIARQQGVPLGTAKTRVRSANEAVVAALRERGVAAREDV